MPVRTTLQDHARCRVFLFFFLHINVKLHQKYEERLTLRTSVIHAKRDALKESQHAKHGLIGERLLGIGLFIRSRSLPRARQRLQKYPPQWD